MARALLIIIALVLVAGATYVGVVRMEGDPPMVSAPDAITLGQQPVTLRIGIVDEGSAIRRVDVRVKLADQERSLASVDYTGSLTGGAAMGRTRDEIEVELDPKPLELPDGDATIVIRARDWSWRSGFDGNEAERTVSLRIDSQPPDISVVSRLTYVRRGGSGAAVYRAAPDADRHGVLVGDAFFRGFPHPAAAGDPSLKVAIFAVPIDVAPSPRVQVFAVDTAGNEARARFPAKVKGRRFEPTTIRLSDAFLQDVAVPLARKYDLDSGDPATSFHRVNTDLRRTSEETIRTAIADGDPTPRWSGRFEQLKSSKVTSRFAELRSYTFGGAKISEARHYGYDLASTSQAPTTASAAGTVVHANDLGIYGGCVLVDHGLGVVTLYGHLSRIDVAKGDRVEQGAVLGLTGATGLAGGDHLHFAVLVGDSYVDPVEWWDPRWVESHITARLTPLAE